MYPCPPPLPAPLQVFERQEIKEGNETCSYRLAQEGLPFILPYITKQRLQMSTQVCVCVGGGEEGRVVRANMQLPASAVVGAAVYRDPGVDNSSSRSVQL